jgi:tetratricopeptide (TPR) repeat protein
MKEFDEDLHFTIIDYLYGRLDAAAVQKLESQMATDQKLAQLVKLHQMEKVAVDAQLKLNLNQQISEWREEEKQSDTTERMETRNGRKYFFWIFLILLLVAGAVYFFTKGLSNTSEKPVVPELTKPLIENNYPEPSDTLPVANETPTPELKTTPPTLPKKEKPNVLPKPTLPNYIAMVEKAYSIPDNFKGSIRSIDGQSDNSLLQEGTKAFEEEKYAEAITVLLKIKENSTSYKIAKEWLAHAYLNIQQFDKAATIFKEIAENSPGRTQARAEWYWLLSLLADYQNNQQIADQLLKKMTDEEFGHIYQDDAKKIKKRLK